MRRVIAILIAVVAGCRASDDGIATGGVRPLTSEQCNAFEENGRVRICHATGTSKHPYVVLQVSDNACVAAHSSHAGDYVAVGDPTCNGGGCLPANAPCDATVPCCEGLVCTAGTCVATTDPLDDAVAALEAESEAPVELSFEGGVPTYVVMSVPVSPKLDDPVAQALDFLERHKALYGLDSPANQLYLDRIRLEDTSTSVLTHGDHLFFAQRHHGIPVYGGELAVHVFRGAIVATNGHYLPVIPPPGTPKVDRAAAIDLARKAVPTAALRTVGSPRKVFLNLAWLRGEPAHGTDTRLAWRVDIVDTAGTIWASFVDVHSGEVLATRGDDAFAYRLWDANHSDDADDWTLWFDDDGQTGNPDSDGDLGNDAALTVRDFYLEQHGRWGFDDQGRVAVIVHGNDDDAQYLGSRGILRFGDGQLALDVLAHEWSHAINANEQRVGSSRLFPEPSALDEGFGHVSAMRLDTDDYVLGEDRPACDLASPPVNCTLDRCGVDGAMYCFSDPPVDYITEYDPNGDPHPNAGILVKTAYLLFQGGDHHGFHVDAIGRAKGGLLYYETLVYGLTAQASFLDTRNAMVSRAQLYADFAIAGFTDDDVCQVRNAWGAVGVGAWLADFDCDGTIDGGDPDGDGTVEGNDNCPDLKNLGQLDFDGDGMGDACDDDIDDDGLPNHDDACDHAPGSDVDDCNDDDGDGLVNNQDNCVGVSNYFQEDNDGDGRGDACDGDDDNDGLADSADNCPLAPNAAQGNSDGDAHGDACDNCRYAPNDDQTDCDGDGQGKACDADEMSFPGGGCSLPYFEASPAFVHPFDQVAIEGCPGCGGWLPETFEITVTLSVASADLNPGAAWIVDEEGRVVTTGDRQGFQTLRFRPRASFHYQTGDAAPFQGTRYFLVLPRLLNDAPYDVDVSVSHNLTAGQ